MIERKINLFKQKWEKICDRDGKQLFIHDTTVAIENLMKHIQSGCLSGIPPGSGTIEMKVFIGI